VIRGELRKRGDPRSGGRDTSSEKWDELKKEKERTKKQQGRGAREVSPFLVSEGGIGRGARTQRNGQNHLSSKAVGNRPGGEKSKKRTKDLSGDVQAGKRRRAGR